MCVGVLSADCKRGKAFGSHVTSASAAYATCVPGCNKHRWYVHMLLLWFNCAFAELFLLWQAQVLAHTHSDLATTCTSAQVPCPGLSRLRRRRVVTCCKQQRPSPQQAQSASSSGAGSCRSRTPSSRTSRKRCVRCGGEGREVTDPFRVGGCRPCRLDCGTDHSCTCWMQSCMHPTHARRDAHASSRSASP